MFKFKHLPSKIKYSSEDKVSFWYFTNYFSSFYFFIQLCLFDKYIKIGLIMIADFLVKLLCSKKLCNSRMLLSFCYIKQNNVRISDRVPPLLTWHIFQIIEDCFSSVVNACVLNQSSSHSLLSYALQSTITMCLKCREEIINPHAH
jgi:hypothetical protein